jgi:hypothetical protein
MRKLTKKDYERNKDDKKNNKTGNTVNLSILTVYVHGLNSLIKRHRMAS